MHFLLIIVSAMILVSLNVVSGKNLLNARHQYSYHLPRIVGGEPADRESNKHTVSLRLEIEEDFFSFGAGHKCGASLIAPDILLSAAHCFFTYPNGPFEKVPRDPSEWTAVLGTYRRSIMERDTVIRSIVGITCHEEYDDMTMSNDIALLFLNQSVPMDNPFIDIIELNNETLPEDTECQASGWGYTSYAGRLAEELLSVNVSVIDIDICNSTNSYAGELNDGQICVGHLEGGMDACQGDSGGPLVCDGTLAGLVSWGEECAKANYPGIYTDIAYYLNWIERNIEVGPLIPTSIPSTETTTSISTSSSLSTSTLSSSTSTISSVSSTMPTSSTTQSSIESTTTEGYNGTSSVHYNFKTVLLIIISVIILRV